MENQKKQSSFINTFAWISIVFSGFGTLIGIMQNIMMQTVMKDAGFGQSMREHQDFPPMMGAMFQHFDIFIMVTLGITIITFIASIGLLKRKNWARLFFIALLILGIVWSIFGGIMQFSMMDSMGGVPQDIPSEFQSMQNIMRIVMSIMTVAMIALYFYLITRLRSEEIRGEFINL